MPETTLHPVFSGVALSTLERVKLGGKLGRKYGKYDFGRFTRLAGSRYSLGKGSIGDMQVACNFKFTESHWGVLSQAENPGGIVYLDLAFTEPAGCYLKGATVSLSLDEEDEDLQRHFAVGNLPLRPGVPVQITEHGPQKLHGEMREAVKATRHFFAPQISAGSFGGFGGVGRESEKHELKQSQWRFSSQSLPNHLGRHTNLRWDLSENELDRQPDHNNTFHTAFAFEHDGQPFFMQVEVSGELESTTSHLRHKVKQRFRRFKFPAEPRSATTMVNFGGRNNAYNTPLDELVKTIPYEMVLANMKHVPGVPRKGPSRRPLYQVAAETEETTIEEIETTENQHQPSYAPALLTATETAELRAEALSVMSFGQLSMAPIRQSDTAGHLLQTNDRGSADTINTTRGSVSQALDAADLTTAVPGEHSAATQQEDVIQHPAKYEEIEKLLREADLPPIIQLIILWLFSFRIKLLLPSKQT